MAEKKQKLTNFPDIPVLFTEAWTLFTEKLLKIIVLWLYTVGFSIGGVVVFVLLVGLITFLKLSGTGFNNPQALEALLSPSIIGIAVLLIIALGVFSTIVGLSYSAATILLLDSKENNMTIWQYLKKGLQYVFPLFLTSLLVAFFAIGSLFFFIIPYIIVLFLFMFVTYVIVLENKRGLEALKMSASIIIQNFWAIIGRIIMLWVVYIAIFFVLGMLHDENSSARGLIAILRVGINIFGGLYGAAYMYLLYKYARSTYDESKKSLSFRWVLIMAVLGWIIAILIGYSAFNMIQNNQKVKQMFQQIDEEEHLQKKDIPTDVEDFI